MLGSSTSMARKTTKGAQVHPKGGVMTIDQVERDRLRNERLAKGWEQKDLAGRAGVTPATISNIESGRTKQPKKIVYAKIVRALRATIATTDETQVKSFTAAIAEVAKLDVADTELVTAFAARLAEARKTNVTKE